MNTAVRFHHVRKEYYQQGDRTVKDLILSTVRGESWDESREVLKNISFEITQGETVGIVGRNGAGKSTNLKLIAGVTSPTRGKVMVHGRVAPLIEVGAGFHHELTGYENIFLNGAILGMSKAEIQAKAPEIIAFSELAEYLDMPVKRYSTGMYMRLGFSIAIHTDAPILLVDEVLAVGDVSFQQKCLAKLEQLRASEHRTIIFVSHDEQAVKSFCERALLIEGGKLLADGKPKEVLEQYHHELQLEV